ncbi:MAG: cell envelope integrity protein TolA, partial [Pseudomonadota bacterium]
AEEAKKKAAAEAAKKKAAEEAKKKAAAEAARKAAEDKKAQALAELLSDTTERQQALADTQGDQVAGSLDDLIVSLVSQQWRRPPSARNGMSVEVNIQMLPDGTITNASVTRSSGDSAFDSSAVAAVRNVGRIPEMQELDRATFDRMYRQRRMIFKPEDLDL